MEPGLANRRKRRFVDGKDNPVYKSPGSSLIFEGILATTDQNDTKMVFTFETLAAYMRVEHEEKIHLQERLIKLETQMAALIQDNIVLKAFYDAKMEWYEPVASPSVDETNKPSSLCFFVVYCSNSKTDEEAVELNDVRELASV
jgi:hypothetical protein